MSPERPSTRLNPPGPKRTLRMLKAHSKAMPGTAESRSGVEADMAFFGGKGLLKFVRAAKKKGVHRECLTDCRKNGRLRLRILPVCSMVWSGDVELRNSSQSSQAPCHPVHEGYNLSTISSRKESPLKGPGQAIQVHLPSQRLNILSPEPFSSVEHKFLPRLTNPTQDLRVTSAESSRRAQGPA